MPDPIMIDDPEPQRYYDWMLWKMRQEDKAEKLKSETHKKEVVDQLMYVTAEECGELVQSCMKIARWGINDDKRNTLVEEAGDVYCMLQLLIKNGVLTQEELDTRAAVKVEKLKRFTPVIVKE